MCAKQHIQSLWTLNRVSDQNSRNLYWWLSGCPTKLFFQNLTKNMMEVASQGRKLENKKWSAENDIKQELWLGVCRGVSTLFISCDHHLFYFIHIVNQARNIVLTPCIFIWIWILNILCGARPNLNFFVYLWRARVFNPSQAPPTVGDLE